MLDLILEALEAIFDWGGDAIDTAVDVASNVDLGDVLLIGSAIYVTNITVRSIQDELRNRKELKVKGATKVIVEDFFKNNGHTVVSLTALNDQNKRVGTLSMEGRSYSGLHKGQVIAIKNS